MSKHLQVEISNLKKSILALGDQIEKAVSDAAKSIETRDAELAKKIIDNDYKIDKQEVHMEEECLKLLALYQPVAVDLRFIVAALKINNDLERIGDLAVNIAERAVFLANNSPAEISLDFYNMSNSVKKMLKKSLDSLVNHDAVLAQEVLLSDDEVDSMNRDMYIMIQEAIRQRPEDIGPLIHLLSVSRHLERIGDHATNIAEDVIYMINGQIVRHHAEDYNNQ